MSMEHGTSSLAPPPASNVETWIKSRKSLATTAAWGAAEGSFFFLVPDMLLTFVAMFLPKRSLLHVGCVVLGSLGAGLLVFQAARLWPAESKRFIDSVPFVTDAMFARVERDYASHGPAGLLLGPTSGTPYKVYAVLAPQHISLSEFLLVSVPARLERLLITWAQFTVLGIALRRWAKNPQKWMLFFFVVYWAGVYAVYWGRILLS